MEYELTTRTEKSILRFRDKVTPKSAVMLVDLLKTLGAAQKRYLVIDVDDSVDLDESTLRFMRAVQRRMRRLATPVVVGASDTRTRDALRRASVGNVRDGRVVNEAEAHPVRLRLSVAVH